jgi:AcrR family transcriptional regulator
MSGDSPSADTEEEIMEATYRALRTHGYADLSISTIAEEFAKSKSLLYYHYDSKDDLLVAFLEYALDEFLSDIDIESGADPATDLREFLESLVGPPETDEQRDVLAILVDLRAQAVREGVYREQFTYIDTLLTTSLTRIIDRGIEQGVFEPVAADRVAAHTLTVINGIILQRATTDDDDDLADSAQEALFDYLGSELGGLE